MSPASRNTRPRVVADDSDSGTEDGYDSRQPLTEADRDEVMKRIAMADLSSAVRDNITSVVSHGPKHVSVRKVHATRECNQPGTAAATIANKNRDELNDWSNFKDTQEAKDAAGEELEDFCGGQFHRLRIGEELRDLEARLGGQLTLDNLPDRRGRGGGMSYMSSRGGSHAVANDRGNFSAGRGGGFAGRGSGRAAALSNDTRPLDPAVDPDRVYKYNDKGRRTQASSSKTGANKSVATMINKTVKLTASETTQRQGAQGTRGQNDSGSSSKMPPVPNIRQPRPAGPTLAGPSDFMVAVKNAMSSQSKTAASQATSSTPTVQQPAKARPGLSDSRYATPATGGAADEKPAPIQRLSRTEFRAPDLSPGQLTDALPSTGRMSIPSPSLSSENAIDESKAGIGLGIQIDGSAKLALAVTNGRNGTSTRGSADIMDIVVPDVNDEVFVPSSTATSPTRDVVTISRAEAEQWNAIKNLIKAGDDANLMKHLHLHSAKKPVEPAYQQGNFTNVKVDSVSHKANVTNVNGYGIDNENLEPIVGDKRNILRGISTQTTPSLHDSAWAPTPKTARFAHSEPVSRPVAAPVHFNKGERATSPITIQSTRSSSYSSAVEYVKTMPMVQTDDLKTDMPLAASQASFGSGQFFFGKHTKNPFGPRQPAADDEDIVLDYGEPVALRSSSGQVTEMKPKPSAGINEKLRMRAARLENAGYVKAGNSCAKDTKKEKATHSQGRKPVASLQKEQAAQKAEAVTKPAPKNTQHSTASAAKPAPSRGGLATSKWATGPAQAPNPASTLRERSPNKGSKGEIELEKGRMAGVGQKLAAMPDEPIFGDSRNISRLGAAATSIGMNLTSSSVLSRPAKSLFPKPIKRDPPGPGFEQLLRDMYLGEASKAEEAEEAKQSGQGKQATTEASSFAQQFGVDYDSDESEL